MFAEAIEDLLRDHCTPAVVHAIEAGADPLPLWQAIAEAGFLDLLRLEEEGGAGLPLPELFAVVSHFGRYAVPLPLAEAIGAQALVAPGVVLPEGVLTLAPVLQRRADGGQLVLLSCAEARRVSTGIPQDSTASLEWKVECGLDRLAAMPPRWRAWLRLCTLPCWPAPRPVCST